MIKNVIFDMDGVIINSIPQHNKAWQIGFKKFKIYPTMRELALQEGANHPLFVQMVLDRHKIRLSEKEKWELIHTKRKEFRKRRIRYFPVIRLIKTLHSKGIKLAIATGGLREIAEEINKKFGNVFDVIVSGEDVKKGKPYPETYLKALKGLKAKKRETLVIENAPLGIRSAKSAGLKVYAITTTLPKKYLSEADKVFSSHKELFGFTENLY